MKVIVTGSAGFIGSSVSHALVADGYEVVGIDNHNDYYDPNLKEARLKKLENLIGYTHFKIDITDNEKLNFIFKEFKPDFVMHFAAQAGVRYSIENPASYVQANLVGFANVLECAKKFNIKHLVYASSSSVYGASKVIPYSVDNEADHPLSLYAATKRSNELMAHSYSHLFQLPTSGLRFFTVYGPWGRPDMALFKFTKHIIEEKPLDIFNQGNHLRDFTYIDDVVKASVKVLTQIPCPNPSWNALNPDFATSSAPWKLFNIGNNNPIKLSRFIEVLELSLGKSAIKVSLPLQPGDVEDTHANIDSLINTINFKPSTSIEDGINSFVNWYKEFYLMGEFTNK